MEYHPSPSSDSTLDNLNHYTNNHSTYIPPQYLFSPTPDPSLFSFPDTQDTPLGP